MLAGLASSQNPPVAVQMDDNGVVIPAHQQRHVRNGQVIRWARNTQGAAWYVKFARTPCSNGAEFGSDRTQTCTVSARCARPNDASCTYHYQSSLGPNQPPHDPDIIVDN